MNSHLAARELPYWLWGAVLLLCACLYGMLLAAPVRDARLAQAVPGFTVTEPHVGQVRVIPQASAALVSPCAAQDTLLAEGEQTLAEL
ncbi:MULTISPECIES: hypothetical protein [unclassified Desulfovibrio]|uniref:hypothetical protein n=1 Tax=unclassified Desulfovibrio TaxID=2593640 RepID=UPI0013EC5755|nr:MULTISPECIES: hypothetical protein [unclassified Desulfovibrio]